jgi:putative oxidoreductase
MLGSMNSLELMKFGPLPIRILVGVALIAHGWPKLSDIVGTKGFFASIGLPAELAIAIALLEVIGGIVILLGILTRVIGGACDFRNDWYYVICQNFKRICWRI